MNYFIRWLSRNINYPLAPPQVMQISLTYRCNLKCKMCNIANLLPVEEELSTETVFHVIDEAAEYGVKEVLLTGGEPFLRDDIFKICEYIGRKGLRSIITTNGALIKDNLIEAIVKSKINHLHFSLDGLEETHDFFRGKGVFDAVISAITILDQKRKGLFSLGIACTVMDNNVNELLEIVKLADRLNVDVINFQPIVRDNANFLNKELPFYWVKESNIAVLEKEISDIRGYKPAHAVIYEEPSLELLIKYYKRKLTKKDWRCFGGFKTAFICYSKKQPLVYSCHGVCGNLNEISLKKAWASKEAYRLRIHSKNCRIPCMQSCYSQEMAQDWINLIKFYSKKGG